MKTTKEKEGIDIDIEFVNRPLTRKEKQSFSEFLKLKKELKAKTKKFRKESTAIQFMAANCLTRTFYFSTGICFGREIVSNQTATKPYIHHVENSQK